MTPPKIIYLQVCGTCQDKECDKCDFDLLQEVTWCKDRINKSDVAYFSEEHIRAVANELYNNGDAFIAKLNGKSFSEYLKED